MLIYFLCCGEPFSSPSCLGVLCGILGLGVRGFILGMISPDGGFMKVSLYVTQRVVDLNKADPKTHTRQVTIKGLPVRGSKTQRVGVTLQLPTKDGVKAVNFVLADSHCIHPKHQGKESLKAFGLLFDALAANPGGAAEVEAEVGEVKAQGGGVALSLAL